MSELPINQVVTGDCREVMAEWPENCIDFVMFSPPFWGLRDYGEEAESVWGGDENCDHKWDSSEVHHDNLRFRDPNDTAEVGNNANPEVYSEPDRRQEFCSRCGAWRGQLGLEPNYRMYVQHLVEVGREIKRILKPSGSWYLNLGDTYAGSGCGTNDHRGRTEKYADTEKLYGKPSPQSETKIPAKCKLLMPYRVALALVDDGWICRNDIIWLKPNPMPSSVKDRLNTTTERIFHFVKEKQYYYDLDAIREPWGDKRDHDIKRAKLGHEGYDGKHKTGEKGQGIKGQPVGNPKQGKNPGDVIEQTTEPFPEAHFAVYPPKLCEKPIKSSCPSKVCVECGEPYERDVEEKEIESDYKDFQREDERAKKAKKDGMHTFYSHSRRGVRKERNFKGWKKTCGCSTDETRVGIVLDPMCGAGSTLIKAKQLGRKYIGIEISEEYAEITRERLRKGDEEYKRWKRKERRLKREAEGTANLEEFV